MPDRRRHRSAGPKDRELFAPVCLPLLREASEHLSWLWSRGYGQRASLQLVGDRFGLVARQRHALQRCAAADADRERRASRCVPPGAMRGRTLAVDAFNVLTTVEVALGGGVVLLARDGCLRDLASMHGTWRRVVETTPSLELLGTFLSGLRLAGCRWLLDAPVSNSGRLREIIARLAEERGWDLEVAVVRSPDAALIAGDAVVASADRVVIDGAGAWFNLARELIAAQVPDAWLVDLSARA